VAAADYRIGQICSVKMRRTVLLTLSVLLFSSTASGFAPACNGGLLKLGSRCSFASSSSRNGCLYSRPRGGVNLEMMLDPAHVDAFVSHAPMLSESLQHVSANLVSAAGNAPAPPVSFLELAASKDYASLSPADATLQRMIGAVYVGPGSEQLQRTLSTFVNTPGIRQVLQLILPPLSVVATGALELALPSYMKVLDIVSKNGGHEGLLPEGIDVTLKAVQRLAAQGEILRAFKVLQAAWPTTSLRVGAIVAVLVAFYVLTPPGVLFGLFDIYLVTPVDKAIETKWTGRDFTIGKQLGGGNFGTVFEATLTDFGAIKLRSKVCLRASLCACLHVCV